MSERHGKFGTSPVILDYGKAAPGHEVLQGQWTWKPRKRNSAEINITVGLVIELTWGGHRCRLWTERHRDTSDSACIWRLARKSSHPFSKKTLDILGCVQGPCPVPLLKGAMRILQPECQNQDPCVHFSTLGLSGRKVRARLHETATASLQSESIDALLESINQNGRTSRRRSASPFVASFRPGDKSSSWHLKSDFARLVSLLINSSAISTVITSLRLPFFMFDCLSSSGVVHGLHRQSYLDSAIHGCKNMQAFSSSSTSPDSSNHRK